MACIYQVEGTGLDRISIVYCYSQRADEKYEFKNPNEKDASTVLRKINARLSKTNLCNHFKSVANLTLIGIPSCHPKILGTNIALNSCQESSQFSKEMAQPLTFNFFH